MKSKPFSKELYDEDDNAKNDLITYLDTLGYTNPRVNPDQYGIDVLAERDEVTHGFEVEVKHNWKGRKFPFPNVHFANRKRKFAKPNSHFVMFNHERTRGLTVSGEVFQASPVVIKKTVYTETEEFAEINITLVRFFTP
jgi:hypothetical protein